MIPRCGPAWPLSSNHQPDVIVVGAASGERQLRWTLSCADPDVYPWTSTSTVSTDARLGQRAAPRSLCHAVRDARCLPQPPLRRLDLGSPGRRRDRFVRRPRARRPPGGVQQRERRQLDRCHGTDEQSSSRVQAASGCSRDLMARSAMSRHARPQWAHVSRQTICGASTPCRARDHGRIGARRNMCEHDRPEGLGHTVRRERAAGGQSRW
jgi:hypothetical protein